MGYTKQDIMKIVADHDIKFIRMQFTDIFGFLKNIALTAGQLEKALDGQCMFDGSSIEGFARIEESDMYLKPDLDSFVVLPWKRDIGKTARMICDVYMPDGTPFEGDPRYILKKVLREAADMGYSLNVGPECEFFLFQTDEEGNFTTHTSDDAGYFDLGPIDAAEETRRDICLMLEEMGFEIEASHHEVARGQHEIDFKYDEAIRSADNIMTFKLVVKTIAQQNGLHATFMPKPIHGICGSGMHVNMSLCKDGKNAFYDEADINGLSQEAYSYIAGLLEHAKGMTALTNPLVNSYKRLVPGYEAPVYIAWSAENRSPLVRIPASRGVGTRVELRNPDPAANPYFVFAIALAAGLDGIKHGLKPPTGVDQNIYKMSKTERREANITSLPADLEKAVAEMKADPLVRETLGEHAFACYVEAKTNEWNLYKQQVHQWEIDRYLKRY